MVAKTLKDKRQYDALVDIFQEADTSNDGKISVEEYMAILDLYRIEISDDEILEVAQMADSNGEIGRDEFLRYIQKSDMYRQFDAHDVTTDKYWKKKIDLAFDLFDRNQDGKLTRKEFEWMTDTKRLKPWQINLLFQRCDLDGDGMLDKEEFARLMYNHKEKKEIEREREKEEEHKRSKEKEMGKMVRYQLEIAEEIEEEIDYNDTADADDECEEEIEEDITFVNDELFTFLEEAGSKERKLSIEEEITEELAEESEADEESIEEVITL